jgi:putative oxidoreductase
MISAPGFLFFASISESISALRRHPMKIVAAIARYLLGLMFLFFGSNIFLRFLKMPPPPADTTVGQFSGALAASGYDYVVGFFQVVPALLLLVNRFVPLALTLLGPVIFNILVFHILMAPSSIGPGALAAVLWLLVFWHARSAFAGIFQAKVSG